MAFDYTTANTGVFLRLGKLIKKINAYATYHVTTFPADLTEIVAPYEAADFTAQIDGIYDFYAAFQALITRTRQELARFGDLTLLDRDTVLEQLRVPAPDLNLVLAAIHRDMVDNSKTIDASTVTLGSVTAGSGNTGTGVFLVSKVLDGYNAPLAGGLAHHLLNGLSSQLTVPSETMTLTCIGDSGRNGLTEGAEQFEWKGAPAAVEFDWQDAGSGQGPGLTLANGTSLAVDGDFENWTNTNTPSNWTIDNGTAGTHILRESTNFYRGTYGFKFLGTGAQATIGVSQSISPTRFNGRRMYLVSVRLKASSVPAAGQFELHFAGTGYTKTAPTAEVQTIQISGTPTGGTYTLSWTGPYGGAQTTAAIAYNATSATVQAALRLLSGLESVVVSTSAGAPPDVTHTITFRGVPGNVNQITADIALLTGGSPAKAEATTTPGVEGDCIVLPAAAFPTTWLLAHFWIRMPAILPSDWELVPQVTSTLSNTVSLYMDSLAVKEAVYHGGVAAVGVAGATRFVVGDRFTFTVANDAAGTFQEYFRKHHRFQLPSDAAGSENILDSLAE